MRRIDQVSLAYGDKVSHLPFQDIENPKRKGVREHQVDSIPGLIISGYIPERKLIQACQALGMSDGIEREENHPTEKPDG